MGFDSTLGFVVNLGAPQSPVAYYQQVGRAGRGTDRAVVVLLPAHEDRDIWKYFASLAFPPESRVRQTLGVLAEHGAPMSTAVLETYVDLSRSRLEAMLKVLDVDGAVRRVRGGWESTGREWTYNEERYRRVAEARAVEQQAMLDYIATDQCRMVFLRTQLDDPALESPDGMAPCGRCDNCGGLQLKSEVSKVASDAASAHLNRPGVPVEPRKMWPTALKNLGIDLAGKVAKPDEAGAGEGRAVARLTDLGYGQALRELFRPDTPDGPVPEPLIKAVLEVLGEWRPTVSGIVYVESSRRPQLVSNLAQGLSRYLQVPVLGRFAITDPTVAPEQGATNSAQRVAAVLKRYSLADIDALDGHDLLLVDDLVVTGWTLTLASRAVLTAGAQSVRPLVLGTQN